MFSVYGGIDIFLEMEGIDFMNTNLDDEQMVMKICEALEGDDIAFVMSYDEFVEQLKELRQSIIDVRNAERLMKEQKELMRKVHGEK